MRSKARPRWRPGSVVLVVVVLAAAGVLTTRAIRDHRAQEILADVLVAGRLPGRAHETGRRLERLIDDYRGSPAAWAATARLAELRAADRQFEEARRLWQGLAERGPNDLAAAAEMDLIHLDREQGRLEELADRLESLIEGGDSRLPEDVLLFELARTLEELGRHDEARAIKRFEEVVPEGPRIPR
jgi:tetratricopeptide (TPR) repeat protein